MEDESSDHEDSEVLENVGGDYEESEIQYCRTILAGHVWRDSAATRLQLARWKELGVDTPGGSEFLTGSFERRRILCVD